MDGWHHFLSWVHNALLQSQRQYAHCLGRFGNGIMRSNDSLITVCVCCGSLNWAVTKKHAHRVNCSNSCIKEAVSYRGIWLPVNILSLALVCLTHHMADVYLYVWRSLPVKFWYTQGAFQPLPWVCPPQKKAVAAKYCPRHIQSVCHLPPCWNDCRRGVTVRWCQSLLIDLLLSLKAPQHPTKNQLQDDKKIENTFLCCLQSKHFPKEKKRDFRFPGLNR